MVNKHRNRPFEIQSKASTTGERGKDKDFKIESKAQEKRKREHAVVRFCGSVGYKEKTGVKTHETSCPVP